MNTLTQTATLPLWEARFFADAMLEEVQKEAVVAERDYTTAAHKYIKDITCNTNPAAVTTARAKFDRSLKKFASSQQRLRQAQDEVKQLNTVTFAQ